MVPILWTRRGLVLFIYRALKKRILQIVIRNLYHWHRTVGLPDAVTSVNQTVRVKQALEEGKIHPVRYENYKLLYEN